MSSPKQTWRHTWLEVWTNILAGFLIACLGNWAYLWVLGLHISLTEVTGLGLFMTALSIARQLIVRRFFEHLRILHIRNKNHASST